VEAAVEVCDTAKALGGSQLAGIIRDALADDEINESTIETTSLMV
jgi:hypothetical protein